MNEAFEQPQRLSDEGVARREAILHAAKRHARRRRAVRVGARGGAAGVLVLAIAAVAWTTVRDRRADAPMPEIVARPVDPPIAPDVAPPRTLKPAPQREAPVASPPAYATFAFATITTEPNIASERLLRTSAARENVISDDELLESLHQAGIDAGLATVGSRSVVVLNEGGPSLR